MGVGIPSASPTGEWACEVRLQGMYQRLLPQRGVDGFQALCLSQKLLRTLLNNVVSEGGKIFWLDETPVSISELFAVD